jgi:hypothetical protein
LSHTTDNVQIRYSTTLQTLITGSPNLGGAFSINAEDTTIYRIIKLEITSSTAQMFYVGDSLQSAENSHSVTEYMFNQIGRRGASGEPLLGRIKEIIVGSGLTDVEKSVIESHLATIKDKTVAPAGPANGLEYSDGNLLLWSSGANYLEWS